ncbi:MAG: DUF4350 domain-containing protein [Nitriliruptorales bacterium]|nr:DUF4350 domain-containing protein [Nitriliruptorales bacterium]
MRTRTVVITAAALTVLGVLALLVAGGQGRLDGPDGTLAFERFVAASGGQITRGGVPVDGATLVFLEELRTPEEATEIVDWVADGGRLVLADPTSEIAAAVGVSTGAFVSGSVFGTAQVEPSCVAPAVVGVERVRVRSVDVVLSAGGQPEALTCLTSPGGDAYLISLSVGEGVVFVLGGRSIFTNEHLRDLDNAVLALRLVGGPGADVVLGAPVPESRPAPGVIASLPSAVRFGLLGLVLAAVTFAAVRWRRLGMPPDEPRPSPIPASALVDATGDLLRASQDHAYVGAELRRHHARQLGRRFGLPSDLEPAEVGHAVDDRLGLDGEAADLLGGPPPRDDDQLLRLARDLHRLEHRTTTVTEERP